MPSPSYAGPKVRVQKAGDLGLGLFSMRTILEGEEVVRMEDPLVVTADEWDVNVGHSRREDEGIVVSELGQSYVVMESSKRRLRERNSTGCHPGMPLWWYLNHASSGAPRNVDIHFQQSPLCVRWIANRRVEQGEELRWDYGTRRRKWLRKEN